MQWWINAATTHAATTHAAQRECNHPFSSHIYRHAAAQIPINADTYQCSDLSMQWPINATTYQCGGLSMQPHTRAQIYVAVLGHKTMQQRLILDILSFGSLLFRGGNGMPLTEYDHSSQQEPWRIPLHGNGCYHNGNTFSKHTHLQDMDIFAHGSHSDKLLGDEAALLTHGNWYFISKVTHAHCTKRGSFTHYIGLAVSQELQRKWQWGEK